MNKVLVAFIISTALVQFILCGPEPVPSIESITNDELASMNADQLTAIILKNIVHDIDEKAPTYEVAINELLQDIDTLIEDAGNNDEKSKLYLNVRQKVEDFLKAIQDDVSACGLYTVVVSVSNEIASFLLFRDQQLYNGVWQKHFNDASELCDFQAHMKNTAITSQKMETLFMGNEKMQEEVTKKVTAELRKCKNAEILGMHFLSQNMGDM